MVQENIVTVQRNSVDKRVASVMVASVLVLGTLLGVVIGLMMSGRNGGSQAQVTPTPTPVVTFTTTPTVTDSPTPTPTSTTNPSRTPTPVPDKTYTSNNQGPNVTFKYPGTDSVKESLTDVESLTVGNDTFIMIRNSGNDNQTLSQVEKEAAEYFLISQGSYTLSSTRVTIQGKKNVLKITATYSDKSKREGYALPTGDMYYPYLAISGKPGDKTLTTVLNSIKYIPLTIGN